MRIIGKIEIKDNHVIKPIQFDGVRKVGNPETIVNNFYNDNFDELLILNITGSLYRIGWTQKFVEKILKKTFIPVTIGGGIKTLNQAKEFFNLGVDKIALNTVLFDNFSLVEQMKKEFGSQSIVCSIQANKIDNTWYAFSSMARKNTNIKVSDLLKKYIDAGVGEILVTSVRRDGTLKGFDEELIEIISKHNDVPTIYSGGIINSDADKIKKYYIDAITVSSCYYYKSFKPEEFKKNMI
jgi:imidazole glycerol-phosphate synthase subunit HisF